MNRTPVLTISRSHVMAIIASLFLVASQTAPCEGGASNKTDHFKMRLLDKKTGRRLLICTEEQIRKYAQLREYLPTLLLASQLKNQRENVESLEQLLTKFRTFWQAGEVERIQVDQVEIDLKRQRNTLLNSKKNYADSLDRLKLALGLPLNLPCELDDDLIRPIASHLLEIDTISEQTNDLIKKIELATDMGNPANLRQKLKGLLYSHPAMKGTKARDFISGNWPKLEKTTHLELDDRIKRNRQSIQLMNNQLLRLKRQKNSVQFQTKLAIMKKQMEHLSRQTAIVELENALRTIEKNPRKRPNRNDLEWARDTQRILQFSSNLTFPAYQENCQHWSESWPILPDSYLNGVDIIAAENAKVFVIAEKLAQQSSAKGKPDKQKALVGVRAEIRKLRSLAGQYENQQKIVRAAFFQKERVYDSLFGPPEPGVPGSNDSRHLSKTLLAARNSLTRSKNEVLVTWINFHFARIALCKQLEISMSEMNAPKTSK